MRRYALRGLWVAQALLHLVFIWERGSCRSSVPWSGKPIRPIRLAIQESGTMGRLLRNGRGDVLGVTAKQGISSMASENWRHLRRLRTRLRKSTRFLPAYPHKIEDPILGLAALHPRHKRSKPCCYCYKDEARSRLLPHTGIPSRLAVMNLTCVHKSRVPVGTIRHNAISGSHNSQGY